MGGWVTFRVRGLAEIPLVWCLRSFRGELIMEFGSLSDYFVFYVFSFFLSSGFLVF